MTDNQAMETTEGLAEQLSALADCDLIDRNTKLNWLLPAIIAALSRPATPAAGNAEVERARIVAWLRGQATCGCKGAHGRCMEDDPPLGYADAIERGNHLGETS